MVVKMAVATANEPGDVISTLFTWVGRNLHFDVTSSENDSEFTLQGESALSAISV
jgi:hypothetical protein